LPQVLKPRPFRRDRVRRRRIGVACKGQRWAAAVPFAGQVLQRHLEIVPEPTPVRVRAAEVAAEEPEGEFLTQLFRLRFVSDEASQVAVYGGVVAEQELAPRAAARVAAPAGLHQQ
jgi:hypothetical protein